MTGRDTTGDRVGCHRRAGRLLVLCALLCLPIVSPGQTPVPCNPVVHLNVENASLSKTLRELSKAHGFALEFPDSVDRPVTLAADLPLDQLLKRLTRGISTSWVFADHPACSGNRIKQLVVYPVGRDAPLPRARGWQNGHKERPLPGQEYIYVDDMEQYVRDVLKRKHRADLIHLTPEQRVEYRNIRKRLRKEMRSEKFNAGRKRDRSSSSRHRTSSGSITPAAGE